MTARRSRSGVAITESLLAMTGMADNPELMACVESWYFSLSFATACSRNSISVLGMENSNLTATLLNIAEC